MALKYCLYLLCLISTCVALQTVNGRIKMTIGTTSGCSDTVRFIETLGPVYTEFGQYLDLEFVPWGRTVRNTDGSLTCQFGVNDCWANRLHRCVLSMLQGNQAAQLHYMQCEFTTPYPAFSLGNYLCAQAVGIHLVDVDFCMSTTGDTLEAPAQAASAQPMAVINFVPFIVFNDNIDVTLHQDARERLRSIICFALADDPTTNVTNCQI